MIYSVMTKNNAAVEYTTAGAVSAGNPVKLNGSKKVVVITADTDTVLGIAMSDAGSGDQVNVIEVTPSSDIRAVATGTYSATDEVCTMTASSVTMNGAGTQRLIREDGDGYAVIRFTKTQNVAS